MDAIHRRSSMATSCCRRGPTTGRRSRWPSARITASDGRSRSLHCRHRSSDGDTGSIIGALIKRSLLVAAALALVAVYSTGASAQADVLQQIRTEALQKSQVMKFFAHLVTVIRPRLTGSPEYKAAAAWSRDTLASSGMADAKLEPFEFGRGWVLDKLVIEMVEPRYMPLNGYAEAWSASTKGELLAAPVFVGNASAADATAMKGRLAGGIVLAQPLVQSFVREDRVQPTTSDTPRSE